MTFNSWKEVRKQWKDSSIETGDKHLTTSRNSKKAIFVSGNFSSWIPLRRLQKSPRTLLC
jgi:hypothetical protein